MRKAASVNWLSNQLSDISHGGPRELLRKLSEVARRLHLVPLLNGIWAVPGVFVIRAYRPLMLIRLGTITNTSRIGHFGSDGAEQVARLQAQPPNTVDWYWLGPTCNSQWDAMLRRKLTVRSWVKYLDWWNHLLPGGSAHYRLGTLTESRDTSGLLKRYDVKLPFLPEESATAKAWLRERGWTDGEPFVCFIIRDSAYLSLDPLQGGGRERAAASWAYHDYRDSDIQTYIPAMNWLADQGVWVLRMGKLMETPLPPLQQRIIDYAFDSERSDLLDIWLFANCAGCVSTATGPDSIASVYDRPIIYINALPLSNIHTFGRSTWIGKHLRWATSEKPLTLLEELRENHHSSVSYLEAGIEIQDLSPQEITEAIKEFWGRETGEWLPSDSDQLRQDQFWQLYVSWPGFTRLHGWMHPALWIGTAWLASLGDDYLRGPLPPSHE